MTRSFRVSADIGGTFTDLVFQDTDTGACHAIKVLSTPQNPALAVVEGLRQGMRGGAAVSFFIHGTTVGLNAVLTRRGAKVGLVTTHGFRDIATIQGNDRQEIFSTRWRKPLPLVHLTDTFTVSERISAVGEVVTPIQLSDLDAFIAAARTHRYEAVAICLLFAFKNPAHELAAADYLRQHLPEIDIVMSHSVSSEWREYNRLSTTVMDAYSAPVVRRYLSTLVSELDTILPAGAQVHVMKSNGGAMTATAAAASPLQTLLSGPVGGAIGGRELAAAIGRFNLVCVDMGGTSFDASLIVDGRPSVSTETSLEGLPIQMSVVDIHVIGAGGGSIAWEEANAIRVGPRSAGSVPGPACYGRGGTDPTVSDANLVLGRLADTNFLQGGMRLDIVRARQAIDRLGGRFGMQTHVLAQGIIDIVNAKMADAIRTITVRRGIDPRDFVLCAFGGAGPSQAADIADLLEIGEVVIPAHPGAFSAWGMLQTDMRHDLKTTCYGFWDAMDPVDLAAQLTALELEGRAYLRAEGLPDTAMRFERSADLRYEGQEYVLTIGLNDGLVDLAAARAAFDHAYDQQYGHHSADSRVEVTTLRVAAIGRLDRPQAPGILTPDALSVTTRAVYFDGAPVATQIIRREMLVPGETLPGPAIIEEATATTLLPPDWQAQVIAGGHLSLTRKKER